MDPSWVCPAGEAGSAPSSRRSLLLAAPPAPAAAAPCVDRPTPEGFTCEQQKGWGKVGTDGGGGRALEGRFWEGEGPGQPLSALRTPHACSL